MTRTLVHLLPISLVFFTGIAGCGNTDDSNAPADEHPVGTCTSAPVDHEATCPAGVCPITADVVIHCTDEPFAMSYGARVAASPDTTYVSTSGLATARLFTVDAAGATPVNDLPLHVRSGPMALAVAADGTLYAAGHETLTTYGGDQDGSTTQSYAEGFAVATLKSGTFTRSEVFSKNDNLVFLADLDVAPDGHPSLWVVTEPYEYGGVASRAEPDAGGKWSLQDAPLPANSWWHHFGFATDGAALGFGVLSGEETEQLFVHAGSQDVALGSPRAAQDGIAFPVELAFPLQVPAHPAAGIAPYAAVIRHYDGLRVAWPTASNYAETTLAQTTGPTLACPFAMNISPNESCPMPCHETSVGLDLDAFAAARTDAGDVWVAYAITHHDEVMNYATSCPNGQPDGACLCNVTAELKGTSSELFVVRLPLDGQPPDLVARLPMGPLSTPKVGWREGQSRVIDARAFGEDVAIAVRLIADGGESVRVIRIHGTTTP